MSKQVAKDIFDKLEVVLPMEIASPPKVTAAPVTVTTKPSFTVVKKNSLTEVEYQIYSCALEGIDELVKLYSEMDEKFTRDCNRIKLELLDVLAKKFGYRDARHAREENLSFKLKANHEVELLKRGE